MLSFILYESNEDTVSTRKYASRHSLVHTRLAPDLHQQVIRVRLRQRPLVLVPQVEIIDAANQRLQALAVPQLRGEGLDERGLAGALHAVQPDDEGPGGGLRGAVGAVAL